MGWFKKEANRSVKKFFTNVTNTYFVILRRNQNHSTNFSQINIKPTINGQVPITFIKKPAPKCQGRAKCYFIRPCLSWF